MKKVFLMLTVILSISSVYAQTPAETGTQGTGSGGFRFRGYGAPVAKVSKFNNQWEILVGGAGGVLINDSLCIGAGGYGMAGTFDKSYNGTNNKIGMGYGGMLFQYYFFPKSLFTIEAGTLIGAGGAGYDVKNGESHHEHEGKGHGFFIVEPEVGVFWNINKFARVGLGGSYRYTRGANIDGMSDKDLRNFSGSFTAAFGWF